MDCWVKCLFVNKFYWVKSGSEDLVNSFINIFLMNIAFWGGSHLSKGWVRVLARLQTISLQVSISGAHLKMFYSQNLSQIKKSGNAARDRWKIRISRVLMGGSALRTSSILRTIKTLSTIFLLEKNWGKKHMNP